MQDLDEALAEQAPPNSDVSLTYDLPALTLDGIPTPVDKMTQVVCYQISYLKFYVEILFNP